MAPKRGTKNPKKPKPGNSLAEKALEAKEILLNTKRLSKREIKKLKKLVKAYKSWHPTKNNFTPFQVCPGSGFLVWKKCSICSQEEITMVLQLHSCRYCSHQLPIPPEEHSLFGMYPNLSKELKGGIEEAKKYYPGTAKIMDWICQVCNWKWKDSINHRTGGRGCPRCSHSLAIPPQEHSLFARYPILSEELKEGREAAKKYYAHSGKVVDWICISCRHVWKSTIDNRARGGNGCPRCSHSLKIPPEEHSLFRVFPDLCEELKEGKEAGKNYYAGSSKCVDWICGNRQCRHEWATIISNRTKGTGCPKCNNASHMERRMHKVVANLKEQIVLGPIPWIILFWNANCRKFMKGQEADLFLCIVLRGKAISIVIEMDGIQHFKTIDFFGGSDALQNNQERDRRKNKHCKDKLYHLLRMDHTVPYENYEKNLMQFINLVAQQYENRFLEPKWQFQCIGENY